ncbi:MAG: hypothetical protein FWG20_05160 [Candidatus Cloacimonetes bacterium]|nr:hypothetical protein [Candidatus Cloacimonadota bacterium]
MSEISAVNGNSEINLYNRNGRIDPYAVFQLNFKALGGEKQVKNDTTFKYSGQLEMNGSTFDLTDYVKKPLKSLRIVSSNYKIQYRTGDDGVNIWAEQDGKTTKLYDGDTPERQVKKLWDEYAYTDPKNKVFVATAGNRKVSIDGSNCYEVTIRNRKTDEVVTHYYDADTYMLKREVKNSSTEKVQTDFDDYRAVGNTLMAHKLDIRYLDTNVKQSIK